MNKLTRISATVASSVALVAGFSGMASAASIHDTGHDSFNKIKYQNSVKTKVHNDTDVHLTNHNYQSAYSGDVTTNNNDNVRNVTSGDASNSNSTTAHVTVDNSASTDSALSGGMGADMSSSDLPSASISDTGHDSTNVITFKNKVDTSVNNETDVSIDNSNCQTATSGDVNANNNDNVRNVSSGDATNTNSSSFSVNVTN